MTLENCPQCDKQLLPPFKSSGRQVCTACGWSNKVRESKLDKKIAPLAQVKSLLSSLTKQQLIIIGSVAVALMVGVSSKIAWANSKTYCLNEDKKEAYKVLEPYLKQWKDSVELGNNTSRMNLSVVVQNMQKTKQEVEGEQWGKCSEKTVGLLKTSMQFEIEGFIKFLDPDFPNFLIESKMQLASTYMKDFEEEYLILQLKQPRKFWNKYIAEKEVVDLIKTIGFKQDYHYKDSGSYAKNLKDLTTPDSNMKKYVQKNFKDYKIKMKFDEEKLTLFALAKRKIYKSFVMIQVPGDIDRVEIEKTLICQTEKPLKEIQPPSFDKDPECANDTTEVSKSWGSY
jgi:hypothetical protein